MAKTWFATGDVISYGTNNTSYSPMTSSGQDSTDATEADMQTIHRTPGTLSGFHAYIAGSDITGSSTITTRKGGSNGTLTVSVPGSASGDFYDLTHTDGVAAGDKWNYQIVVGTGGVNFWVQILACVFNSTSNNTVARISSTTSSASTSGNGTTFYNPSIGFAGFASTESLSQTKFGTPGTASNMFVHISSNARTTTTTFGSRKNTANGNLTISIGAGLTGDFEDTSHSDTLVPGDIFNYFRTMGASAEALAYRQIGCDFTTTNNSFVMGLASTGGNSINSATTIYYSPVGNLNNFNEGWISDWPDISFYVSQMYINVNANTLNTGTSTVNLRKNLANGTVGVSIGAGVTGVFSDTTHKDYFHFTTSFTADLIDYQFSTSGSSGAASLSYIMARIDIETPPALAYAYIL